LAVHQADFFVEAEPIAQSPGALFDLARGQGLSRLKIAKGLVGLGDGHVERLLIRVR